MKEDIMKTIKDLFWPASITTEEKILRKGRDMMFKTYEEQKDFGMKLQNKFDFLMNGDILTTELPFRDEIPKKYCERIKSYRKRVREIISGVAAELQEQKFKGLDHEIKSAGLSKYQERRYIKVRDAQKELYASYDAVRESLNYITDFNNFLLKKINESSGMKKTDLLLLNAIIIYELTDAIIYLIDDFQLRGKDTLRSINNQVLIELKSQQKHDDELWTRASGGSSEIEKSIIKSTKERSQIRDIVAIKWQKIWEQVSELEKNISSARGYLPTLRLIRDNAKGQLNILEVIGITQIVQSNIRSLQEICAFTNIELAPLTKEDVFGLIGRVDIE